MIRKGWRWKGRYVGHRVEHTRYRTTTYVDLDLRIPPYQREYVWTPKQALALLDSICWGLPIGTFILHEERPGPEITSPRVYWMLDGQQRLTTLRGALLPESSGGEVPRIFLDPIKSRFVIVEAGEEMDPRWPPLAVLTDTGRLMRWMMAEGSPFAGKEGLERDGAEQIFGVMSALEWHETPAMILPSNFPVDEIPGVFERHNAAGTQMSRRQLRELMRRMKS